jgi:hypothetical protein
MGFVRGITGADDARRGARAQEGMARDSMDMQQRMFDQSMTRSQPFVDAGRAGLGGLMSYVQQPVDSITGLPDVEQGLGGLNIGNIQNDSLFQFLRDQAMNSIQGSAAARGKLGSGSTLQEIGNTVQNLALSRAGDIQGMRLAELQARQGVRDQLFGERFNQANQRFDNQYKLASLGSNAAAGMGNQALGTSQLMNSTFGDIGNASAARHNINAQSRAGLTNMLMGGGQGAMLGGFGQLAGMGAAGGAGGALGAGIGALAGLLSDERAKTDIKKVGELESGVNIYTYRYKDGETYHMGVMAQEVREKYPEAVAEGADGLLRVNYGAL